MATANAVYVAAGHSHISGRDRGSAGNGLIEGLLNQRIVARLVYRLRQHGITTYTDLDIGNPATRNSPNQVQDSRKHSDVKLYFEQHFNAFGSSTARGHETYKTGTGRSKRFGSAIYSATMLQLRKWDSSIPARGLKEARGTRAEYIVVQSQGAAVLDEALFLTNVKDAALAKRKDFVNTYAEVLTKAIVDFGRSEGLWTVAYKAPTVRRYVFDVLADGKRVKTFNTNAEGTAYGRSILQYFGPAIKLVRRRV